MPDRYQRIVERTVPPRAAADSLRGQAMRRRLLVGALAGSLVLAGVATVLSLRSHDTAKQRATHDLQSRATLGATVFDTYFAGRIAALAALAKAPPVVDGDTAGMRAYFRSVQAGTSPLMNGGVSWIDATGRLRASSTVSGEGIAIADRAYFKEALRTGKPYVSEGLVARGGDHPPVIVTAVPTRDRSGRTSGVLIGSLQLATATSDKRSIDLGYAGLEVLDRSGRELVRPGFRPPANAALAARARRGSAGVLAGTAGLDGKGDRVVAYAPAAVPGWTVVLDQPSSMVFAAARRTLWRDLAVIAVALAIVLGLAGWGLHRNAESEREQAGRWDAFTRGLTGATIGEEVSEALAGAVGALLPDAVVAVVLAPHDARPELGVSGLAAGGPFAGVQITAADVAVPARAGFTASHTLRLEDAGRIRTALPGWDLLGDRVRSLHVEALRSPVGDPLGAIVILLAEEGALDGPLLREVRVHAEEAARSLVRTRSYEVEHDLAVRLQRNLLPAELPAAAGVELVGRYQAGSTGIEVGGDWYDVVSRPDGVLHLVVGDVAGRGVTAASLMGYIRSVFRAYALEYDDPGEIVARLLRHLGDDEMATAVVFTVDLYTREVAYASAGHPPALLLDAATGEVARLDSGRAAPLGFATPESVRVARRSFPAQATLVAYTDGLVERRGSDIYESIDHIATALAASTAAEPADLADELLAAAAATGGVDDDVALLVVKLGGVPATLAIDVQAAPGRMSDLRRRLDAWLDLRGVGPDDRVDIVLAVSEACNNAIVHAYERKGGTIRLTLEHAPHTLLATVEDRGAWQPPRPRLDGGRGLSIMERVMARAQVSPGSTGTRVTLERRLADAEQ